jgi:hypothetical protein
VLLALTVPGLAQTPPSASELQAYRGLHAAAAKGDVAEIEKLVKSGAPIDARDGHARTPLHVAAFMRKPDAARAAVGSANALGGRIRSSPRRSPTTPMLVALEGGCRTGNIAVITAPR